MKPIRGFLDRIAPYFEKGAKLERLYPVYEVVDSFFYSSGEVTEGRCHVRDAMDLKRVMSMVLVALIPCVVMAMYNTGLQANTTMAAVSSVTEAAGLRGDALAILGVEYDPHSPWDNLLHGAAYFIPIYVVCMITGIAWEAVFCVVRKHEFNEGFFVTGLLFPLTLPATIPLWQVVLGTSFGVVVAKEIFGGTGRNFLNPALAARAFLFFAYPREISGDTKVWTAIDWSGVDPGAIDGLTGATPLALAAEQGMDALKGQVAWSDAFVGTISGSMGETSTMACLIGAAILIFSGIGSWRIMASMLLGALGLAAALSGVQSTTNLMFAMPAHWHLVLGGFAFGL
ncbi:MAG: NADH:ubiquinone reductase (Na(+)-transporting) subunit B, partial [Planctomycetes bacterium]|nr:NADH:ubiquinone reductase (Na(+)-transporting) subunit B [Planctomycetota bacterium]